MSTSKLALSSLFFAIVPLPAEAQQLLRKHVNGFGYEAAAMADLDGDAVVDLALQRYDPKLGGQETVELRSGASGALIRSIPNGAPSDEFWDFGVAIADAGDVDGDGVHDLLVGAPIAPDPAHSIIDAGGAFVYSGRDGSLLWSAYGTFDNEWFGYWVAGLDDVDGDGHADFLVGSFADRTGRNAFVTVFSGASGASLYVVSDAILPARLSDHDGDGVRDFVVIWGDARIHSGATGALIVSLPPIVGFNGGLAELDDIDGDGEPELALGEYGSNNMDDGQVRVVSIPNQTTLRTHLAVDASESLGERIDSGFDADGDGVRDYLVSAKGLFNLPGSASLFSGRTGERLYRFIDPDADFLMGCTVAGLGDLDGDGFGECVVGSPYHFPPGTTKLGADLVFRGNDLWLDAYPKSVAAGATETIAMHGAPNGQPVALFVVAFGSSPAFQLAAVGASDSVEAFLVSGLVPTGFAGTDWTLRAYALDANGKLMESADEVIAFK